MGSYEERLSQMNTIVEKCFDRLYSSIEFIIVFYGAVLAFSHDKMDSRVYSIAVFAYLLPIGTYVIGLLYMLNLVSIARATRYMLELECEAWKEAPSPVPGWNHYCEKHPGGRRLAYGTAAAFFVAAPIFDYIVGNGYVSSVKLFDGSFISCWLPAILFLVYIAFFAVISVELYRIRKK